jgi:hypothetical protein
MTTDNLKPVKTICQGGLESPANPRNIEGGKYTWSELPDETLYGYGRFNTIDECMKDAIAHGIAPGETIWIVTCEDYRRKKFDAADLIDDMKQDAYEVCGDAMDHWLKFLSPAYVEDLGDRIDKVIDGWLKDIGCTPNFYHVSSTATPVTVKEFEEPEEEKS